MIIGSNMKLSSSNESLGSIDGSIDSNGDDDKDNNDDDVEMPRFNVPRIRSIYV